MFIMTYANFFLSSTNVVSALYSIRRNWLRRRKAVQLIAQDQKRIKAEIRAGRSIEAAIVLTVWPLLIRKGCRRCSRWIWFEVWSKYHSTYVDTAYADHWWFVLLCCLSSQVWHRLLLRINVLVHWIWSHRQLNLEDWMDSTKLQRGTVCIVSAMAKWRKQRSRSVCAKYKFFRIW